MLNRVTPCLVVALGLVAPVPVIAQARPSESAVVGQTVAGTRITLEYYRPVARGRANLFGGLVHWGELWTPGANWATTLEVSRDVELNGHKVLAGKYAIWMIPRQDSAWTVLLHKRARAFHTIRPVGTTDDVARFEVKPQTVAHTEVLTWSFPDVSASGTEARMAWGTTALALRFTVQTAAPVVLTAEQRKIYTGRYRVTGVDPRTGATREVVGDIMDEGGNLVTNLPTPVPPGRVPGLVPAGDHRFYAAGFENGKQVGVEVDFVWTFTVENGRATGFEARLDGNVIRRGVRIDQ